jgi:hypothetical protein
MNSHEPMTFEELTKGCTPVEIDKLAWFLAQMRARSTWEALRYRPSAPSGETNADT